MSGIFLFFLLWSCGVIYGLSFSWSFELTWWMPIQPTIIGTDKFEKNVIKVAVTLWMISELSICVWHSHAHAHSQVVQYDFGCRLLYAYSIDTQIGWNQSWPHLSICSFKKRCWNWYKISTSITKHASCRLLPQWWDMRFCSILWRIQWSEMLRQ